MVEDPDPETAGAEVGATVAEEMACWLLIYFQERAQRSFTNLGNGAWAVGDGQGGRLRDCVGLVSVGQSGGRWAVGGECGDNLSGVDSSVVPAGESTSCGEGKSSE